MTSTITKMLFVLLLAVSALGCDPYHRHYPQYSDYYGSGYYNGSGYYDGYSQYAPRPYYDPYGRNWSERRRHHDYDD